MNSFSIYTTINSSININTAFLKTIPPALTYSNPSMTGPSPYPIVNVLLSAMLISHAPLIPFPIQNSSQNSRVTASRAIFYSGSSLSSLIDPNRFVKGLLSLPRRVISGIPQGSALGPCLFNLFINDVTDTFINVTAKLFADDVKLYTELSSPTAVTNFQSHLDLIQSWSTTWQINISYTKCNILEIGNQIHPSAYSISNQTLTHATFVKDLEVLIDPKLKFDHHILDFVNRARQRASLIFRCFLSRDTSNLKRAFTTYVRPLVEYASPVWSPSHIYLINAIESVQRAFTKRLPGFRNFFFFYINILSKKQPGGHKSLRGKGGGSAQPRSRTKSKL